MQEKREWQQKKEKVTAIANEGIFFTETASEGKDTRSRGRRRRLQ